MVSFRKLSFNKFQILTASVGLLLATATFQSQAQPTHNYYFDQAAQDWESQSLPIGNGAIGASVMGGVNQDRIIISEKTLWTGGPGSVQGYDYGLPANASEYQTKLAKLQNTLAAKGRMTPKAVADEIARDYTGYGSFQKFADLVISPQNDLEEESLSQYQRSLNMQQAAAQVNFNAQGIHYKRRYFVSYPDQALVVHYQSDKKHQLNLVIDVEVDENRSFNKKLITNSTRNSLIFTGELNDNALEYAGNVNLYSTDGEISKNQNNQLLVNNASEVWLTFYAATNYAPVYPNYRGESATAKLQRQVKHYQAQDYSKVWQNHLTDYQGLFNRVELDLTGEPIDFPINQLLTKLRNNELNQAQIRSLTELYYQLGRYLLITSSRSGSLPANLQGAWNNHIHAPWNSDYHFNINVQMNYWLANQTNLDELNKPLFDFVQNLQQPGEQTAKALFGSKGWTLLLNTNIWGFTGLIEWPTAFWQPEAAAWICQHLYEHYQFTLDNHFLQNTAYPIMKSASQFWLDNLYKDTSTNSLVVNPSYSPEHGDFTLGAAMSQQIIYELLSNTKLAARELADQEFISQLDQALNKLEPGLKIGKHGQLMEWRSDLDDMQSKHRHVSHLYALHPSNQISPITTPALAKAAEVSLNARGDGGTGWSKAWKINFWARLFNGDRAEKLIGEQLKHSTLDNLWDNHPPFQIDGNFGATAGITEMLLQSQVNQIHLLPALPKNWQQGQVSGLKARGNVVVDISWNKGQLASAKLTPKYTGLVIVRSKLSKHNLAVMGGNSPAKITQDQFGTLIKVSAQAGQAITINNTNMVHINQL
ncbi:glycosyl hydrolase family 95 catalytic domain-containing protein [Catenovulum sp. SX2]|uniref:glycoside hydrolase family 95 protein n=1 Tax=Catenovulum sp. SX2 TaxID=3398614 RepID=UPI003F84A19B